MTTELTPEQAALIDRNEVVSTTLNEEEEIYKENIIDHYKNPRNKGLLVDFDLEHRELNPLCGDDITVFIKLDDGRIIDISFQGHGCAISQAAVSLLTDHVKEMTFNEIYDLTDKDVVSLLGIPISHVRMKCATLSLIAIQQAMGAQ